MKGKLSFLSLLLLAAPLVSYAGEQLVPAGSMIQCTVSEPKLSSKTADVGDPVLCQVSHVELYGRSTLPYGSYLEGRFEDYKDPGHLVGKGWMELKFDRMIIQPDTVIPISAKVVYVPGYPVDKLGRIHGKGHPVADTVEWLIPVLWPIDLINLPRRGPRPTLKAETKLTLKVMDDFGLPTFPEPQREPSGLLHRDNSYVEPPPPPPVVNVQPAPAPVAYDAPPAYLAPPPMRPVYIAPPPPYAYYAAPRPVLVIRNGIVYRTYAPR